MIPFLQKQDVTRFDGWRICGNDGFKLKKGTPKIFLDESLTQDFREDY